MKRLLPLKIFKSVLALICCLGLKTAFAQAPVKMWDKTFGGNYVDDLKVIKQTSDGGFMLGGGATSDISGDKTQPTRGAWDFWLVKTDSLGNKLWDRVYGGNSAEVINSFAQTSDGGFILGGNSGSDLSGDKSEPNFGSSNYWILKIDGNGNKQWDKTIGGNFVEYLSVVLPTSDNGYILGGSSLSSTYGDKSEPVKGFNDFWIVKTDAWGNKQWDKTIGGDQNDFLTSIQEAPGGGYILGGTSESGISFDKSAPNSGPSDFWIVKIDNKGNKLWDKTFGGNKYDNLSDIFQTQDGYILGGSSNSDVSGNKSEANIGSSDFWILKIDEQGNKIWDKTLGGNYGDELNRISQAKDGSFYFSGRSSSDVSGDKSEPNKGGNDIWVVKTDAFGTKIWDKTLGGSKEEYSAVSFDITSDSGFIVGCSSESGISGDKTEASRGNIDFWILKFKDQNNSVANPNLLRSDLLISPNPIQSGQMLSLSFNKALTSPAIVNVYDTMGKLMLQQPLQKGETATQLLIKNLKAGLYQITVTNETQNFSSKLVVQ